MATNTRNALSRIESLLYEANIPKTSVLRIYSRKQAVGVDMREGVQLPIGDDDIHFFHLSESKYAETDTIIYESVVDAEKKVLNPKIWDGTALKKEIRTQILSLVSDMVTEFSKKHDTDIAVKNVYLTGSNLGFYYNQYTDIDVHFTVDAFSDELQQLMGIYIDTEYKDKHFIDLHPIEFYLMSDEQEKKPNLGGIYDLINETWVDDAHRITLNDEDYEACLQIALHYARKFDLITGELKRDIIEYRLQNDFEDELVVDGDRPEQIRRNKWIEIQANCDAIVLEFDALKDMRKKSFEDEFKQKDVTVIAVQSALDKSFTTNNIVFKILDRYGYIPMAKSIKYGIHKKMREDTDLNKNRDIYIDELSDLLPVLSQRGD
jgi:hypothetical protein